MVAAPHRLHCMAAATRLAWVSTAPLGRPVVPPVNWIRAGSSTAMSILGNEVLVDASQHYLRVGEFARLKVVEAADFDLYAIPV